MTSEELPRPAEYYVLGRGADAHVVVPARAAAWLNARGLDELRARVRGADPLVDQVLLALSLAGTRWRASADGSRPAEPPEAASQSPVMTTTEAADLLGVTD